MPRPTPGGSNYTWGEELNAWLDVGHNPDGTNKTDASHAPVPTPGENGQTLRALDGAMAWQYPSRKSINIRNKGAVEGTDIRTALAAAIADASPGQTVYIPSGDWFLAAASTYSAAVTIGTNRINLVGDGPSTRIRVPDSAPNGTRMIAVSATGVTIEGLSLNLSTPTGDAILPDGTGLYLTNATDTRIAYVDAINPSSGGIHIASGVTALSVDQYRARGGYYGILTDDITSGGNWSFTNLDLDGQGAMGDGLEINCPTTGVSDVEVLHVRARNYASPHSNAGFGVGFARVHRFTIDDVSGHTCGRNLVHVEDRSSHGIVSNVRAWNCGHGGIELQSLSGGRAVTNVRVKGFDVSGCNTAAPDAVNHVGYGAVEIGAFEYGQYITIQDGETHNNGQAGVYVLLLNDGTIKGVRSYGNAGRGMYLIDFIRSAARENDTHDNTGATIETAGSGLNSVVEDNYFRGTTTNGFSPAATWARNR